MVNPDQAGALVKTPMQSAAFTNDEDGKLAVEQLALGQLDLYRRQPKELVSHANRETAAIEGYRGRQLLELLQNADDAAGGTDGARLHIALLDGHVVVANSGVPFSPGGLESLVISDCSPKQLDRNRYIGCKGLGFRSVLTWSDCPLLSSGHLSVGFDREQAGNRVEALRSESPSIRSVLDGFVAAEGHLPIPVMRFPFVPAPRELELARKYRKSGFDTVLVLRLPGDGRYEEARRDVLQQLDGIQTEALLFCRSLAEIEVVGTSVRRWEILRDHVDSSTTQLIIQSPEGDSHWALHRREGRIERSDGARPRRPREYETAVAVPSDPVHASNRCLCVFFPTKDTLPLPMVLHATLELSDDRNRVHDTVDNREVLGALAAHVAEIVTAVADPKHPRRALRLIDGLDRADPELRRLGFVDRAVAELRSRRIFPRIDGTLGTAAGAYRTPHDSWHPLLSPSHFPDVLDVRSDEKLVGVLSLFDIGWYDASELLSRLRRQLEEMEPLAAGELVGRLLATERLGKLPLGTFILTTRGAFLGTEEQCFFTPGANQFPVPEWAQDIQFVHPEFQRGLQAASGASNIRALVGRLEARDAKVDEYRLDTVVRALVLRAKKADEREQPSRVRELLKWLFHTTRGEPGALSGVTVPILDSTGSVVSPSDCYLGAGYPGSETLHRLYSAVDGVLFSGSPDQMGLSSVDAHQVGEFLVALGVHERPRAVPLLLADSEQLARRALEQHEYPSVIREVECEDLSAAERLLKKIGVEGVFVPDHLDELLHKADPAALVAYLLSDGQYHLTSDAIEGACFVAQISREQKLWQDRSVRIPNPVMLALRSTDWVPTEDGTRCTPGKVILSGAAGRLLRGLYSQHAINVNDPAIRKSGGRRAVNGLLTRLGAISSLEAIDADSLYELLSRLPDDDPEGRHAPGVYRTLIEGGVMAEDSAARRKFFKAGQVWSRFQGRSAYLPVLEARYNANLTVPRVIEQHLKIAEFPRRKSTKLVRELFGVEPLATKDIKIALVDEGTEYAPSSEDANVAFRRALPYLYAIRLGKKLDEDNRERNLLHQAELRLCTRMRAEATLPGGESQIIELDGQGERLLLDRTLYIIDDFDPGAPSLVRFWQSVAALVAELLGTDVAAEAANVLRCRSVAEMEDVVRGLVDEDAEAKLQEAHERFRSDAEEDPPPPQPVPPPSDQKGIESKSDGDVGGKDPATGKSEDASGQGPGSDNFAFQPVQPPKRRPGARRKLVVAAAPASGRINRRGPLATEDVTFQVVEAYEILQGRYPVRVSHLRGSESFGCDIIGLDSAQAREHVVAESEVEDSHIARFIEVKGRSSRSGEVELTENEYRKAELERERYFLYRVFRDPHDTARFEVAILKDPVHSGAVRQVIRFDLSQGSGAQWLEMVAVEEPPADDAAMP
ncbi:MAG: DUF3883 domain-containing protein [Phycisphaerales bacterium]